MNELTNYRRFKFNGSYKREKEDFTYTLFIDYDFQSDKQATSFFRSDFRGARFENITFFRNNFDRADFISCSFFYTTFDNVNIASCEMKSCFYKGVTFHHNTYNNTSFQECTFIDCVFENEDFLINMKNCKFVNCQLRNLKFERSTTESLVFVSSTISNTDFANMHAERYKFISCTLQDVLIDVCYIYGYLFFNTNVFDIKIIYMGEVVSFTEQNILQRFASNLWGQSRYYEFINAYLILGHINDIEGLLEKAFVNLLNQPTPQRNLEIYNIFDMLQFYISNNTFNFTITRSLIEFLESQTISALNFEEKITYMSQLEKIKVYLSDAHYDLNFILSAQKDISFVTFYCKTNNYDDALNFTTKVIESIYSSLGLERQYMLIDAQQGSWILTFAVISSCVLMLPKLIKETTYLYFELNTKQKISKRITDKLKKKMLATSELRELTEIALCSGLIHQDSKEVDVKDIAQIVEMIKIGI